MGVATDAPPSGSAEQRKKEIPDRAIRLEETRIKLARNSRRPTLFLDIDGVLNNHAFLQESQSRTICPKNVFQFNRILRETGTEVVLSSAWRYLIHQGDMTCAGFMSMLRTHGVLASLEIVGVTQPDEVCAHCERAIECGEDCYRCQIATTRADQVMRYVNTHDVDAYVVIDDCNFGFTLAGIPFIHTNGKIGLTNDDADQAIRILNRV